MNLFAHKKILLAILAGVGITAGAYFVSTRLARGPVIYKSPANQKEEVALSELIGKDSDLDGIKDWEEALWDTDPNKKDTDGDGVSDGAEIAARKKAAGLIETATSTNTEKLNETDAFSREFFAAVLSLKQSGQLNDDTINNLSKALTESLASQEKPRYAESDMRITTDTKENIESYASGFWKLAEKYVPANLGNELSVIAKALNDNDQDELNGLDYYIEAYQNISQETLALGVPRGIAMSHLALTNSYASLSVALQKIKSVFENPLVAMIGLSEHKLHTDIILKELANIGDYFSKNGIIFSKK